MIHVNSRDGHEMLTPEEFAEKHPALHKALTAPLPFKAQGEHLKGMRKAADMTVREMAKAVGIGAGEISAIETGRTKATEEIQEAYRTITELAAGSKCDHAQGEVCCGSCADLALDEEGQWKTPSSR